MASTKAVRAVRAILDYVSSRSLRPPPGRSFQVGSPAVRPTNREIARVATALWVALMTPIMAPGTLASPADFHAPRIGNPAGTSPGLRGPR